MTRLARFCVALGDMLPFWYLLTEETEPVPCAGEYLAIRKVSKSRQRQPCPVLPCPRGSDTEVILPYGASVVLECNTDLQLIALRWWSDFLLMTPRVSFNARFLSFSENSRKPGRKGSSDSWSGCPCLFFVVVVGAVAPGGGA